MTIQRIVCAKRARCHHGSHLVSVCLGEENGVGVEVLSISEIYSEMDRGVSFVTFNGWHQAASVLVGSCGCGVETLQSEPGSAWQNDVARLKECRGNGNWDDAESDAREWARFG
jgi:hypothetical protein